MILACHINAQKEGDQTNTTFQCEIISNDNQTLLSLELADTNTLKEGTDVTVNIENSREFTEEDSQKLSIWLQQLLANYLVTQ